MARDCEVDDRLVRLRDALISAGVVRGTRDKSVANVTGYALGSVRSILSGHAPLTDRFVKAVCSKFNIRLKWVEEGEEPILTQLGEQPYPGGGYRGDISKVAAKNISIGKNLLSAPIGGNNTCIPQININSRAISSLDEIFSPPVSEKQLKADISRHFEYCSEECSDDLNLGEIMSDILFHLPHLARHEVLELLHQIWKLRYNRSDSLAVQVADEDFERYGIKPTTRLKLERIPVEAPDGEEAE